MADIGAQSILMIKRITIRCKTVDIAKQFVRKVGQRAGIPDFTVDFLTWKILVDRLEVQALLFYPELRNFEAPNLCYRYPYSEE